MALFNFKPLHTPALGAGSEQLIFTAAKADTVMNTLRIINPQATPVDVKIYRRPSGTGTGADQHLIFYKDAVAQGEQHTVKQIHLNQNDTITVLLSAAGVTVNGDYAEPGS